MQLYYAMQYNKFWARRKEELDLEKQTSMLKHIPRRTSVEFS